MYAVHHGLAPSHITELMTSVAAQTSRPRLRLADTTNYVEPRMDEVRRTGFLPCRPCYIAWNRGGKDGFFKLLIFGLKKQKPRKAEFFVFLCF